MGSPYAGVSEQRALLAARLAPYAATDLAPYPADLAGPAGQPPASTSWPQT